MKSTMIELDHDDVAAVSGGVIIYCCDWNFAGIGVKANLFTLKLDFNSGMSAQYGFNQMSAYNRL